MTSSISREIEKIVWQQEPFEEVMLNGTCFKTFSSRHIVSQRILGELAVKEALMSDFLLNLVPYVRERRNIRVAELTYVHSN